MFDQQAVHIAQGLGAEPHSQRASGGRSPPECRGSRRRSPRIAGGGGRSPPCGYFLLHVRAETSVAALAGAMANSFSKEVVE